jgi:hypothetical protein
METTVILRTIAVIEKQVKEAKAKKSQKAK